LSRYICTVQALKRQVGSHKPTTSAVQGLKLGIGALCARALYYRTIWDQTKANERV